jgi:tetratricopeptide (TPR) repeat protein
MTQSQNAPAAAFGARHQARARLEQADNLRRQGQLDRAESLCFELTRRYPDYVAALHTLGLIHVDRGNFQRALDCLIRAQMLDPDNGIILTALGLTYMRLGAREMAARTLGHALAGGFDDASMFASLGELYRDGHDYKGAEEAYRNALKRDHGLESSKIGLALCLSAVGKYAEAADVLQDTFRQGHCSLSLLDAIASLPQNNVSIDLTSALDLLATQQRKQDAASRNTFAFVRAAALHGAGRFSQAWDQLEAANHALSAQHKAQLKEDVARQERSLARLRAQPRQPAVTGDNPFTLFILGPSRSGKSSLELLLGSLDGVAAAYEAPIVDAALRRAYQAAALPAGGDLDQLPSELQASYRDRYIDELTQHVGSARVLTSALSDHIHHVSAIAPLIPNVRFVLMRRNPQDTALRIYLSKYLRGNAYAYDLKSIADYLAWYDAMIALVAEKHSEMSMVVTYEDMIADPSAVRERVAGLVGLSIGHAPTPDLVHDRDVAKPYDALTASFLAVARSELPSV